MAALARRSFANLRDELLRRLGREGDTTSSSRVEHLIDAAYRLLSGFWHHHQLEESVAKALAAGTDNVSITGTPYVVVGAVLYDQAGTTSLGRLLPQSPAYLFGKLQDTARPKHYTRFGSSLFFDSKADAAYSVKIFYVRRPVDPDFAAGATAETDRLFDEVILELAQEIGFGTYWSPELSALATSWLGRYLPLVPNPTIGASGVRDKAASPTEDRPPGGATG